MKSAELEEIKGCIFDLDGVIVDTARYHYLAWKRLADELAYHLTEADNERLKGVSRMASLEIVLDLAGVALTPERKVLLADKKNTWFNEYLERMRPEEIFPGVKELIADLRAGGLRIGLASSSKNARTVMRLLEIEDLFDTVVDGNMIRRTKPDPEIFLLTAARLGLDPASCVVIEDAASGIDAARAAGMRCIGIGSPSMLGDADKVFHRTADIKLSTLQALERIGQ